MTLLMCVSVASAVVMVLYLAVAVFLVPVSWPF